MGRASRTSDIAPISAARSRSEAAWHLHARGASEAARDAAIDATIAWAQDPGGIEEEELVELLEEVCDVESRAIIDTILGAGGLSGYR